VTVSAADPDELPPPEPPDPLEARPVVRNLRHESASGARGARRPSSLAEAVALARPVSLSAEQTLPVLPALAPLLPDAALRRGSTVAVEGGPGATSLALALGAAASQSGSWTAIVGVPALGLAALAEAGVDLARVVLVDEPDAEAWGAVVASLVGAVDLVVVAPDVPVTVVQARRLAARARERGSVVVAVGGLAAGMAPGRPAGVGLDVDVRLAVTAVRWGGLAVGHGSLTERAVEVTAVGRRQATRPRRARLWLPGPDGGPAPFPPDGGGESGWVQVDAGGRTNRRIRAAS